MQIEGNTENNTITMTDNGFGYSWEEAQQLMTSVKDEKTLKLLDQITKGEKFNINQDDRLGIFALYLVSKRVHLITKQFSLGKTHLWDVDPVLGTCSMITGGENLPMNHGTKIILFLKDDATDFAAGSQITYHVQEYYSSGYFKVEIFPKFTEVVMNELKHVIK